jgi:uncharacterized membrane protein YgcG
MKKALLFLFILGTLFVATPVFAQDDRILEYRSDIVVNRDTTIEIKEAITFQPSDMVERHGLEWTIPYEYSVSAFRRPTKLDIKKVKYYPVSNPQDITYNKYSRTDKNGWAILRIGDANTLIYENHVYEIEYVLTYTAISYFDEWDEVYLNIIGPGWNFPIENASATLTLPVDVIETICYTGGDGSKEQDCTVEVNANVIDVKTNGILNPYEGYNIVIKQPVGTFEDTTKQQATMILLSNIWILLPIPVGIFLFLFLKKKYKNPKLTVIPQYEPLQEYDALTSGLMIRQHFNTKKTTAALIELAIKGYFKIREQKKGKYEFVKGKKDSSSLPAHLKELVDGIFAYGDTVPISKMDTFYVVANKANSLALKELKNKGIYSIQKKKAKSFFMIIPIILVVLTFNFIPFAIFNASLGMLFGIGVSFLLMFIFSFSIDTLSKEGNKVYHHLLGLKMYINTAEKERIKFHSDPKKYKNVFEALLPYAMIFNLEKKWANEFKDLYKVPPEWYEGDMSTFNTAYLVNSLSSFNRSVVSSSTPSNSSYSSGGGFRSGGWSSGGSGFGGGGSSGGGGGGSGGGGW